MSHSPTLGPTDVTAPVVRALDALIATAAVSFVLSVASVAATLFEIGGSFHWVTHMALPAMMGLVIVARSARVLLRHPPISDDAWARARSVSSVDAGLAYVLSWAVPLAWLAGGAAILLRHSSEANGIAAAIGLWLPLSAALWIGATFAWIDACRDRISAALGESDRRFREYWRDIARH